MRITNNSQSSTYQRNIFELQESVDRAQNQVSTGSKYQSLAQQPKIISETQDLSALIDKNNKFRASLEEITNEMYAAEFTVEKIAEKLSDIRQIAVDATRTAGLENLPVMGQQIFQKLTDLVKESNADYAGRFSLSGTKNTPDSIVAALPAQSNQPFELVQDSPSGDNPSGYRVVFKGNFEKRIVDKSFGDSEQINMTADEIFGAGGTETFQRIIELYNAMSYRPDGSERKSDEPISVDDQRRIQGLVASLSNDTETTNAAIGKFAFRRSRMESIAIQMAEENTRIREIRSQLRDTNMPEALLQLKREQNAYEYTLQVASTLFKTSLMDFLR